MTFPCTKCGLCCMNLHKSDALSSFHAGDGICKYFDKKIGCTIYSSRPQVCKIDDGYKYFTPQLSLEEYYQKNAQVCNQLQQEQQLPENFRVLISTYESPK